MCFLIIVFGCLVKELRLGPVALKVWFVTLVIGTWANGTAGFIGAFIGASSRLMPTITEKFPPPISGDNQIVTGMLLLCGVTLMVAFLRTPYGLLRSIDSE